MASIKGFQLKAIKKTLGREGEGVVANAYLDGKKIGEYADYGDGGMGNMTYLDKKDEEKMMKIVIAYAKEHPSKEIVKLYKDRPQQFEEECERFKKYCPYIPDKDITIETMSANSIEYIVEDFLNLAEDEKFFKKQVKKGYKAVSTDRETCQKYNFSYSSFPPSYSDEKIDEFAKEHGHTLVYRSLSDFVIK